MMDKRLKGEMAEKKEIKKAEIAKKT